MNKLKDKLQTLYVSLLFLLSQFQNICAINLSTLPEQINKIVVGDNRLPLYSNGSLQEVTEDDLKHTDIIPNFAFANCNNLVSVVIPNNIITIESYAFLGCRNLMDITLPTSLVEIQAYVFSNCSSLTDIYLYAIIPPVINYTDSELYKATIHVPVGSGDAYKSATNWSQLADQIVEDIVIE